MKFINIDRKLINLDLVTSIVIGTDQDHLEVRVVFVDGRSVDFKGELALALQHYVGKVDDVLEMYLTHKHEVSTVAREKKWGDRVLVWCTDHNIRDALEIEDFRNWLYCDGDFEEPSQEQYEAFKNSSKEKYVRED